MFTDFIHMADADDFWIWTGILSAAAVALAWGMATLFHRARVIENTPTSKLRSAAQGFVELEGTARAIPGTKLVGPLSQRPCVWFEYEIEKYVGGKNNKWRTIERDESDDPFLLDDGTGTCLVLPDGASITPSCQVAWQGNSRHPSAASAPQDTDYSVFVAFLGGGRYRYTERRLLDGDPLYCLGNFRTESDATRARGVSTAIREALQNLKENREVLLRHFDKNGDGEIDTREWERARQATVEHVKSRHHVKPGEDSINILSRPTERRRPFILSTTPQHALARRLRTWAALCLAGFVVAAPVALYLIVQRLGT
ncbi:MAG TPA: hypothetical protein ENJ01_05310 [Gammaproteobacteria bacterium]|nr:hypothetical protein [Gammaproteobacteria bacterium]